MSKSTTVSLLTAALAFMLLAPSGVAFQTTNPPAKNGSPTGPSDKAIAAAKVHGLVWVPKNTKDYFKSGRLYGKGEGEFMPEEEAQKAGNHEKS